MRDLSPRNGGRARRSGSGESGSYTPSRSTFATMEARAEKDALISELEQAKAMSKQLAGASDVMLRVSPHVADSLRTTEREVMEEVEAHFGTPVTIEPDPNLHQEQFDFAVI